MSIPIDEQIVWQAEDIRIAEAEKRHPHSIQAMKNILATLERVKAADAGLPVEPEYAEACEFDNEDSVVSRIEYDALRGHIIRARAESAQTCRLGCTENCGSCVPTETIDAGLPVEPKTFKFAIDIDTPVAYVVLKDDYDTLRDYAVQSDIAAKIHAKDVFNLTEKVIPNIRERAEKAEAENAALKLAAQPINPCCCVADGDDGTLAHMCKWHEDARAAPLGCLQWLENNHALHHEVKILYVVDGYEVTVMHEDGVTALSETYKGATLLEAINQARGV